MDGTGKPIELVGYRVDITERKQAEKLLLASDERLRIALGAASAIAFVWDLTADRIIRHYSVEPVNPASPEKIADVKARIHPDDLDQFSAGIENCLNGANEYHNLYRVFGDDGSAPWLEERGTFAPRRGRPPDSTDRGFDRCHRTETLGINAFGVNRS